MADFLHIQINAPSASVLRAFPAYAQSILTDTVDEITDHGAEFMRGLVPRGQSGNLSSAVSRSGPTLVPGRVYGSVFVDPFVAPYADLVDRGTGHDGPYRQGVIVTRPSRSGKGQGAMKLPPNGKDPQFQRKVKMGSSQKIRDAKNFSGRTYEYMREVTGAKASFIAESSIPNYFRATGAR